MKLLLRLDLGAEESPQWRETCDTPGSYTGTLANGIQAGLLKKLQSAGAKKSRSTSKKLVFLVRDFDTTL